MKSTTSDDLGGTSNVVGGWSALCSRMDSRSGSDVRSEGMHERTGGTMRTKSPKAPMSNERKPPQFREPVRRETDFKTPATNWEPVPLYVPVPEPPTDRRPAARREESKSRGVVIINYGDDE